jgi:hypothetical protein
MSKATMEACAEARRNDVEVEHLARGGRPLHGEDDALRRAVDGQRDIGARPVADHRIEPPQAHRRGVPLEDGHQGLPEDVEHRRRGERLIRRSGGLERDVAEKRVVDLRRRAEGDGLDGDEALAQLLRQTGHRREAEEASAGGGDQGGGVLDPVGDENHVQVVLGIGLPLAHPLVDAGADGGRASRHQRVGRRDDGVPGAGVTALQEEVGRGIGAGERLRLRGGVEEDQADAVAGPLRPAARRRVEQHPLADEVLHRRLEDLELLRTAGGAGREIVHAAGLVEDEGDVEHVAPFEGGRERGGHAVVGGNEAGRRVAGVLRHLRALGERRGDDVARHAKGGHVLRADEAHRDVLLDGAAAGAEVRAEVGLRDVGDADVVAGERLVRH